jgi:hypothetical protein
MVAYLTAIELRRRWRSTVLLALLVATVVGIVVATTAGARRSSTSFDRYLDRLHAPDAIAFGDPAVRARLGDLDAVQEALEMELPAVLPEDAGDFFYPMVSAPSGRLPYDIMRMPVTQGRLPDPSAPLEVALSERTAARLGLGLGDELSMASFSPAVQDQFDAGEDPALDGPRLALSVVGIVRDPGDIGARKDDITLTFLSPAFRDTYGPDAIGTLSAGTFLVLRPGRTLTEVTEALKGEEVELDTSFFTPDGLRRQLTPTVQAIGTALAIFAAVVALAGLAAVAQLVARLQQSIADDDRTLAALGCARTTRWARLVTSGTVAIAAGTALGVAAAAVASPLFPVGLARQAEPDPGFHLDAPALLGGGVAALVIGLGVVGGLALWRVRRSPLADSTLRVSALGRTAARSGAPTPVVSGLSFTSGTPGAPGRAAVGGVLLGVLGVVATVVFGASVARLQAAPHLYGWGWDAIIEGADLSDLGDEPFDTRELVADPDLTAVGTVITQLSVTIDGVPEFATATRDVKGHLRPVVVAGRAPVEADEIALGGDTADRVGAGLGDTLDVGLGDSTAPMAVTGIVALPVSQDGGSSASGAYFSGAAADQLGFDDLCEYGDSCSRAVGLVLDEGVAASTISERYQDPERDIAVYFPTPPPEVERLTAVQDLPTYLAGFLALLAAIGVSFAAATTVRRRRADLAVLRTLGMTARQLRTVISSLVLALTCGGALAGSVLGLVVGRQVWRAVAASVSLPFAPDLPLAAAVAVPALAVLLAQVTATLSRRAAGRTPAAIVLRTE